MRELKVGDIVKFKDAVSPKGMTLPTISEILSGGWVVLQRTDTDGKLWNSSCHVRELELVSDGSEPRQ
jgi:hypothetical protein